MSFCIANDKRRGTVVVQTLVANIVDSQTYNGSPSGGIDITSSTSIISGGDIDIIASNSLYLETTQIITTNSSLATFNSDTIFFESSLDLIDSRTFIANQGDNTKQITFNSSAIASATTRIASMPNANVEIRGRRFGWFTSTATQNLGVGVFQVNITTKVIELGVGAPQYTLAANEITFGGDGQLQLSFSATMNQTAGVAITMYCELDTGGGYNPVLGSEISQSTGIGSILNVFNTFYLSVSSGDKIRFQTVHIPAVQLVGSALIPAFNLFIRDLAD